MFWNKTYTGYRGKWQSEHLGWEGKSYRRELTNFMKPILYWYQNWTKKINAQINGKNHTQLYSDITPGSVWVTIYKPRDQTVIYWYMQLPEPLTIFLKKLNLVIFRMKTTPWPNVIILRNVTLVNNLGLL